MAPAGGYTALATSPSSAPRSPFSSDSSSPALAPPPRVTKRLLLLTSAFVLLLLFSVVAVPSEHLPTPVQGAVSNAKEAVAAAKAGRLPWAQAGVTYGEEGVPAAKVDPWVEDNAAEEEKVQEEGVKTVDGGEEKPLDHAVVLPLPTGEGEKKLDEEETWTAVDEVEEEVAIECSSELKAELGKPDFWSVTEITPLSYRIAPRTAPSADIPSVCLSQAVFAARLVTPRPVLIPPSGEMNNDQVVFSLPRPSLAEDLVSYELVIPAHVALPKKTYELDVRLDFGLYVGVMEGTTCGEGEKSCNPLKLSEAEGPELRYGGKPVEVVKGKTVELGSAEFASSDLALPLCSDLSSLSGFWSSLSYTPTSPSPCTLATPSLPLSFVPSSSSSYEPLWIHLVGDSNSRNMYNHLLASLGNGGRKVNAPKLRNSPTHNGTVASAAFKWRDGSTSEDGSEAAGRPDIILTWQWWYQASSKSKSHFDSTVAANRAELVSFVDATLAQYLQRSNMPKALQPFATLKRKAATLRPHRTYLSLGSHGEELTVPGVAASLDAFFDSTDGLSRAKREQANLRLFTTTLVNARYIPLARFPHQDLVRANALIEAKNEYAAARPEFADEGRVIDVEALTRGIVEEDGWMKPTKNGPDAVHFRDEVYDEWVRVVWTDLMKGVEVEEADEEERALSGEEVRRRWKRRIAWVEEAEEDEEED
ncbi:hypothetical protein JCM8097_005232 [Rhodosporidiobolus ruineniae]